MKRVILFLTLLCAAIAVSSCDFFAHDLFLDEVSLHTKAKPRTLTVNFAQEKTEGERTVVPNIPSLAKSYVISYVYIGTPAHTESKTITSGMSCEFSNVFPGSMVVTVNAYSSATVQNATTLIVSGSSTVTLADGESASVAVTLVPLQTAGITTGSLSLNLVWPASTGAEYIEATIDEALDTIIPAITNSTVSTPNDTRNATITKYGLSSGTHLLKISFYDISRTILKAVSIEAVNVYDGLQSTAWIDSSGSLAGARTFTASEFALSGSDLSLRILCGIRTYQKSFLSSKTSDTIMVPSTTPSISVFFLAGTVGQKLQYSWDGPVPITLASVTSGDMQMLSLPSPFETAKTLTVTVTAPDGSSRNYTLSVAPPMKISTKEELVAITTEGMYILTANVDLAGVTWPTIGDEFGGPRFTGTFDGGGHIISNLSKTTTNGNAGMFSVVGAGAVISNVRLENASINGGSSGDDGVGGIAGENFGGTITHCSVSGSINGDSRVGGIVGNNRSTFLDGCPPGVITECYSTATVTATREFAGGIAGTNWGIVSDCYARSVVTAPDHAGGLFGRQEGGTVTNCYAAGTIPISAVTNCGFMGPNDDEGIATNCFYDMTISGLTDVHGATPKSTLDMQNSSTYDSWDFTNVWAIDPTKNGGYPFLRALPIPDDIIITPSMSSANIHSLLENNLDGNFILSDQINLSGYNWAPIGSESAPFTGTFDGNGKSISNMTFSRAVGYAGFFGNIGSQGVVKNLKIINASISTTADIGGCVAGYNSGTLYRCLATGSVTANGYTGGLVGVNNGLISQCYSTASVSSGWYTGGLVGKNKNTISDSYAKGAITVRVDTPSCQDVGGLVGLNETAAPIIAKIVDCYATGTIVFASGAGTGTNWGGLVGLNTGDPVTTSYYDKTTTLMTDTGKGTGETSAEMKNQSTFSGFSFNVNAWGINSSINGGYPYLVKNAP